MLDIEDHSGTAIIRLHHGKVNALDLELLQALTAAMRDTSDARAVVITGAGPTFSAGVDLRRITAGGPAYIRAFLPALTDAFIAVFDDPRPVVAAVNGHAIAGGCVIAAACDVRLMSQGSIGLAELSVGVPFPTSALEIMRHAIGPFATRLALTRAMLDPQQARAVGLIDQIEEPDSLLDAALTHASALAALPADVFGLTKRQLQQPARARIGSRQSEDDPSVTMAWCSPEVRAGIDDFVRSLANRVTA